MSTFTHYHKEYYEKNKENIKQQRKSRRREKIQLLINFIKNNDKIDDVEEYINKLNIKVPAIDKF